MQRLSLNGLLSLFLARFAAVEAKDHAEGECHRKTNRTADGARDDVLAELDHVHPWEADSREDEDARVEQAARKAARAAGNGAPCLPYLSGIQMVEGETVGINGPMSTLVQPTLSNYYLAEWFGEATLTRTCNTIALVLLTLMLGGLI